MAATTHLPNGLAVPVQEWGQFPDPQHAQFRESGDASAAQADLAQKWSAILAVTRRLYAEAPAGQFTVRKVADATGLSTQAIHNRHRSRAALITAAINDYSQSLFDFGCQFEAEPNPIIAFANVHADACLAYPAFYRRTLLSAFFDRKGAEVFEKTHKFGIGLICRALADMQRKGLVGDQVDLRIAGSAVSSLMATTMVEWARGTLRQSQFRQEMSCRIGFIFSGLQGKGQG